MPNKALLALMFSCFSAGMVMHAETPKAGEYDEEQRCIIDITGLCSTEYVDEVLKLCEDCDVEAPELVEVSDLEAWFRSVGIKLFYAVHEHPYAAAGVVGLSGYALYRFFMS